METLQCPACGAPATPGATVCMRCGEKIAAPTPAPYDQYGAQAPVRDTSNLATASLVLGLVGIVAWFIPFVGLPVTVLGIVFGVMGRRSAKANLATIGLVLSIIFLAVTLVNSGVGAYLGFKGAMEAQQHMGRY